MAATIISRVIGLLTGHRSAKPLEMRDLAITSTASNLYTILLLISSPQYSDGSVENRIRAPGL